MNGIVMTTPGQGATKVRDRSTTIGTPGTVKSAASSPLYTLSVDPGSTEVLPKAKVVLRDGSEVEREYRPGTTSAIHTEAANAHVRVINSDESYDEDVNPDDGDHQVPDARAVIYNSLGHEIATVYPPSGVSSDHVLNTTTTHTDSTGEAAPLPIGEPMVCTPPTPLTCTITASTTTPGLFASVTLTCDQSGYATYSWKAVSGLSSLRTQNVFSFAGQAITFRPIYDGTWTVELTVTNAAGMVGRATATLTVSNGVRYCGLTVNTAPPGAANVSLNDQAGLSPIKYVNGMYANHLSTYHASRLAASVQSGILWKAVGYNSYDRYGLSTTITYASSTLQSDDPAWKWQVGGFSSNNLIGRKDNGSPVAFSSPTRRVEDQYWFRMDRAVDGTVRLYVLNETRADSVERLIQGTIDWTLLHTFSQTSTAALYIRGYVQSVQGANCLYMYGPTE